MKFILPFITILFLTISACEKEEEKKEIIKSYTITSFLKSSSYLSNSSGLSRTIQFLNLAGECTYTVTEYPDFGEGDYSNVTEINEIQVVNSEFLFKGNRWSMHLETNHLKDGEVVSNKVLKQNGTFKLLNSSGNVLVNNYEKMELQTKEVTTINDGVVEKETFLVNNSRIMNYKNKNGQLSLDIYQTNWAFNDFSNLGIHENSISLVLTKN